MSNNPNNPIDRSPESDPARLSPSIFQKSASPDAAPVTLRTATPPPPTSAPQTQDSTPLRPSGTFQSRPTPSGKFDGMPAKKTNHVFGGELYESGKVIGPMPIQAFLDTFLPQNPEKTPHRKNIFAGLDLKASDKARLNQMIAEFLKADFIDISNTMDSTPKQSVYGIRDRVDASIGLGNGLCYATLATFIEFKGGDEENNIGVDEIKEDKSRKSKAAEDTSDETVRVFLKISRTALEALGQVGKYANHSFSFSDRKFLFTVYIRGLKARLFLWDRSGCVISEEFDIKTTDYLSIFFHRFSQADRSERGFDETVVDVTSQVSGQGLFVSARESLEAWAKEWDCLDVPLVSKKMSPKNKEESVRWLLVEVPSLDPQHKERITVLRRDLYEGKGEILGRGTRAFPGAVVSCPTSSVQECLSPGRIVLVKDSWRPKGARKEWEIIQELTAKEVPHTPTVLAGGELPEHYTRTPQYIGTSWARGHGFRLEVRVHQRFIQAQIGVPLSKFEKPQDMFAAVLNALEAHKSAYLHGWLHRDISDGNILMYPKPRPPISSGESEQEWGGSLIDWEYGHDLSAEKASQVQRTGTYAFMSRRLLSGEATYGQDVTDDLESFFWVILYTCLRYLKTDVKKEELSDFLWNCFYEDWPVGRISGKLTGGRERITFVSKDGRIGGNPVEWTHQPPISAWLESMVFELDNLTRQQNSLSRIMQSLQAGGELDESAPRLSALTAKSRARVLRKDLPLSERFLADCNMASHDWFLQTLRTALQCKDWNSGRILKDEKVVAVEGPCDQWVAKPTHQRALQEASTAQPATSAHSSQQKRSADPGSSQPAAQSGTGSAGSERANKRQKIDQAA